MSTHQIRLSNVRYRAQIEALILERSQAYIERERALVGRHQALFLCEKALRARDQALADRRKERVERLRQEQQFYLTVTEQEELIEDLQGQVRRLQQQLLETNLPPRSDSTCTTLEDDTPPQSPSDSVSVQKNKDIWKMARDIFSVFQESSDDDDERSAGVAKVCCQSDNRLEWEKDMDDVWEEHRTFFLK